MLDGPWAEPQKTAGPALVDDDLLTVHSQEVGVVEIPAHQPPRAHQNRHHHHEEQQEAEGDEPRAPLLAVAGPPPPL